jgi:Ca2+-binding RTX toxin-like protein
MAYAATGTAGNDTLNQSGDSGPGTIVGLAGDDQILTGSGLATVTGDSGGDSVVLRAGNTGTVNGGSENDSISDGGAAIGSMQLFGSDGADTIWVPAATAAQTIVGGNDSNDGADSIAGGTAADIMFGNGGNDSLTDPGGSDTYVGGFGNDSVLDGAGSDLVFGNQGNDTIRFNTSGNPTAFAGLGNDSVAVSTTGDALLFGNEGADTVSGGVSGNATVVGGNDSADGNDSFDIGASGALLVFGNGGADTFDVGSNTIMTVIGGQGGDSIRAGGSSQVIFGNEGNDTMNLGASSETVFGGQGNDLVLGGGGRGSLQGNEGNDTISGGLAIDTIAGGSGNDVFTYGAVDEDGNNALGGGPLEQITDVNWGEDKVDTATQVTFAINVGVGTGGDLNTSANNAVVGAFGLAGGGANVVAAQFTFAGRTYLAIDQAGLGTFVDAQDLLLDITGVTGAVATSNFV